MPRRTAKPTIRIDSGGAEYRVTFYPVVNLRKILYKSVLIPKGDPAAFKEQVDELIDETRKRFGRQGK